MTYEIVGVNRTPTDNRHSNREKIRWNEEGIDRKIYREISRQIHRGRERERETYEYSR